MAQTARVRRPLTLTVALLGAGFLLGACAARPVTEMTLADTALKAAQKAKADALAPDDYRRAENFLLRAKRDYAEGYYDSARKFARDARVAAERAEYTALKKQAQLKSADPGVDGAPANGASEGGDLPPTTPE
jgi:major membrane immunogen (membrane-anchored lipoprotein)